MEKCEILIVTINFNTSKLILRQIENLKNQTFQNYKIVVVDNGSSVEEQNILITSIDYSKTFLLMNNRNLGFSTGNNLGVKYFNYKFKFILFINSDAFFTKNTDLELLYLTFDRVSVENPKIVAISPIINTIKLNKSVYNQHQNVKILNFFELLVYTSPLLKRLPLIKRTFNNIIGKNILPLIKDFDYYTDTINGACFMVKYDFFDRIGQFDERTFLYGEEMIFGKTVKNQGMYCMLTTRVIVDHLQGVSSPGKTKINLKNLHHRKSSELIYLKYYLKKSFPYVVIFRLLWFIDLIASILINYLDGLKK